MDASQNGVCMSQQICLRIVFVIFSFVCDAAVANPPLWSSTKLTWWRKWATVHPRRCIQQRVAGYKTVLFLKKKNQDKIILKIFNAESCD